MTAVVETAELAPGYSISRVIRGGWQLAGGHGAIDRERAVDDLIAALDAGVFTFDCADIYTGVEELYGAMRARLVATRGAASATACACTRSSCPTFRFCGQSNDAMSKRSSTARSAG